MTGVVIFLCGKNDTISMHASFQNIFHACFKFFVIQWMETYKKIIILAHMILIKSFVSQCCRNSLFASIGRTRCFSVSEKKKIHILLS